MIFKKNVRQTKTHYTNSLVPLVRGYLFGEFGLTSFTTNRLNDVIPLSGAQG